VAVCAVGIDGRSPAGIDRGTNIFDLFHCLELQVIPITGQARLVGDIDLCSGRQPGMVHLGRGRSLGAESPTTVVAVAWFIRIVAQALRF